MVAEARKRRDAQRAAHQHERARLAMVSDERKKTSKQIDRMVATAAAAAATEPVASDGTEELPDDPEALTLSLSLSLSLSLTLTLTLTLTR